MSFKKFFLALIFVAALSLPAAATDFTIVSTAVSADIIGYEPSKAIPDESGDIVSTEPYYYLKTVTPYRLPTIADALSFANSPADYALSSFGVELSGDVADSFPLVLALRVKAVFIIQV